MILKNFGEETRCAIKECGHTIDDILWVGNYDFYINVDEFFKIADNTYYNNGFGVNYIPIDLMIVFHNRDSLRRMEYDGSEWWKFYPRLVKPSFFRHLNIKKFTDAGYGEN